MKFYLSHSLSLTDGEKMCCVQELKSKAWDYRAVYVSQLVTDSVRINRRLCQFVKRRRRGR